MFAKCTKISAPFHSKNTICAKLSLNRGLLAQLSALLIYSTLLKIQRPTADLLWAVGRAAMKRTFFKNFQKIELKNYLHSNIIVTLPDTCKEKAVGIMRVIAGSVRGRRLKEPADMAVRPTADRVKEGLFNALQFELEGSRVLDLFAGTGQLGIEALSRGANAAVFLDHRQDSLRLVRENLQRTGLGERAQVLAGDALTYLKKLSEPFHIILLDPPYADGLLSPALELIFGRDLLNSGGIAAVEYPVGGWAPPALSASCRLERTYRYGKTGVMLFRRLPSSTHAPREE